MIKKVIGCIALIGLCVSLAGAEEQGKKSSGVSDWLKAIQKKIERIVPKKSVAMTTGVAGVRGAKEESQVKLYWKGKKGDEAVTEEELQRFKSGVELAEKGDKDGSIKALEEFMKQYPDSALIPDVKKTLDMVKSEEP